MADLSHKQFFYGGLTSDTHPKAIKEGDFVYMLNMRNSKVEGQQYGGAVNVKGNTKVNYQLPQGQNKGIGSLEDAQKERLFYWVWNSNGDHRFVCWLPKEDRVIDVISGSILNLNPDWNITQPSIIDGRFVQWGEAKVVNNVITGNPPRYVDTTRAILDGKFCEFDILVNGITFNDKLTSYSLILTLNGVTTTYPLITGSSFTPAVLDNKADLYARLKMAIDIRLPNLIEADDCGGCSLKLTMKVAGDAWVQIVTVPTSPSQVTESFFTHPQNRYHRNLDETSIQLGRLVPICPPSVKPIQDNTYQFNYIQDRYFQFSVRYVYWDFQKSTFGSFSAIAGYPTDCTGNPSPYNAIEIDFTNDLLNNEVRLADIKYVEIAVREGNTGSFRRVTQIDACELDFPVQKFIFKNDGAYPVIADEEAYRSFNQIPLLSTSHIVVDDRSFWGGTLERYDNLDCVEAKTIVSYEPELEDCKKEFVTIKGRIRIFNRITNRNGRNLEIFDNEAIWTKDGSTYYFGGINNRTGAITSQPVTANVEGALQKIPMGGFPVYLAGTNFYAISKQIAPTGDATGNSDNVYFVDTEQKSDDVVAMAVDNGIWSEFEIKNVPKGGIYILRVASHLVREDDTAGSIYNINNGLEWQRTSTYIRSIGGVDKYEILIDTNVVGDTIDLSATEEILINDLVNPAKVKETFVGINFYVTDALTNHIGDLDALKTAIQVERCIVNYTTLGGRVVASPQLRCDHNGYFYISNTEAGVISNPDEYLKITSIVCADTVLWEEGQSLYLGNYFNILDNDTPASVTEIITSSVLYPNMVLSFAPYNRSTLISEGRRTFINGKVVQTDGAGISGISVVISECNRVGVTDVNGNYTVSVYATIDRNRIVFSAPVTPNNCCPSLETKFQSYTILNFGLTPEGGTYNINNPFIADDFIGVIDALKLGIWKHRNNVQLGIKYYDEYGRSGKVQVTDALNQYIPFWTEPTGVKAFPIVSWEINHTPPVWARRYQIVRTLNPIYSKYLQFAIAEPRYVRSFGTTIVDTTWAARDATEVYIPLTSLVEYSNENSGSILSWEFNSGDRITLMKDEDGNWFNGYFDYRVENDRVDTLDDVTYLVIPFGQNQPQLKAGATIEVYSPRVQTELDLYYEITECYSILNAGTANRLHGAGNLGVAQTATTPATGTIKIGDAYYLNRIMPIAIVGQNDLRINAQYESEYMDESVAQSKVQSIGRADIIDKDYLQTFFYTRLRYTGRYLPNTNVNAVNQFTELDFVKDENDTEIDRQFGCMMSVKFSGNVILAIMMFKCVPIYTNATPVYDLNQQSILTKSRSIAVIAQPIREDRGTQNPESVTLQNGNIFGWDAQKNAWWRYGFNGLYDISDYEMISFFNDVSRALQSQSDKRVYSCYDRQKDEFVVTYPSLGITISFNETLYGDAGKNRWMTFYSFVPDYYGIQGNRFVSLKDGELWAHDTNSQRTSFYGVVYGCGVDYYVNNQPDAKKMFWGMRQKGTDIFVTAERGITVFEGEATMSSELRQDHFSRLEGDWWADMLRDIDDPEFIGITPPALRTVTALLNGRVLRGDYMLIKLRNFNTNQVTLFSVNVQSSPSQKTKE